MIAWSPMHDLRGRYLGSQCMYFGSGVLTWWRLVLVHQVDPLRAAREMWGWARG